MAWFSPNPLTQSCLSQHYQALWLIASWEFTKLERIFLSIQSFHLKRSLPHHGCLSRTTSHAPGTGEPWDALRYKEFSSSFANWKETSPPHNFLYHPDISALSWGFADIGEMKLGGFWPNASGKRSIIYYHRISELKEVLKLPLSILQVRKPGPKEYLLS